jgi:hypothetical protein
LQFVEHLVEVVKRDCKIIGMSVDPVSQHGRWSKDIEETQGYAVNYPNLPGCMAAHGADQLLSPGDLDFNPHYACTRYHK